MLCNRGVATSPLTVLSGDKHVLYIIQYQKWKWTCKIYIMHADIQFSILQLSKSISWSLSTCWFLTKCTFTDLNLLRRSKPSTKNSSSLTYTRCFRVKRHLLHQPFAANSFMSQRQRPLLTAYSMPLCCFSTIFRLSGRITYSTQTAFTSGIHVHLA